MADQAADGQKQRAQKTDHAVNALAGIEHLLADRFGHAFEHRQARSADFFLRAGVFQRFDQAFRPRARPGQVGVEFSGNAAGDPGADRVDFADCGQVDLGYLAVQRAQIVIDLADRGHQEGSRQDEHIAPVIPFDQLIFGNTTHCGRV